jgi:hypothetical protein
MGRKRPTTFTVDPTSGCWLFDGGRYPDGYGRMTVDGKGRAAHIVYYERFVGPVPAGLVLDHVRARGCVHRHCVNPAHLEPVTIGENVMRGDTIPAANAAKTHCKHGHEFTPENTQITTKGARRCRACRREDDRRRSGSGLPWCVR